MHLLDYITNIQYEIDEFVVEYHFGPYILNFVNFSYYSFNCPTLVNTFNKF